MAASARRLRRALAMAAFVAAAPGAFADGDADDGPPLRPGATWNESRIEIDVPTSRPKRRLTTRGLFNNTPYHHFGTLFTDDSRFVILNTTRPQGSALLKADVRDGRLTVLAAAAASCAVIPRRNAVVAVASGGGRTALKRIDLDTLRETALHNAPPDQRVGPVVAGCDGRFVFWSQCPKPPIESESVKEVYDAYTATYGGIPTAIYELDLDGGGVRRIYDDPTCRTGHMHANPVDPDLLLIERDQPPWYAWRGDLGKTTRDWVLNRKTGKLTEIRPRNAFRFQMHAAWSGDGRYVLYHSRDAKDAAEFFGRNGGAHYIGVADLEGTVKWERTFPYLYYGHVTGHTRRPSVVFDGLTTPDLICEIDYGKLGGEDAPEIKILARHGSILTTGSADSHPHMLVSPDGKWLVYNWGDRKRSDVYVVPLE
jgi:hypothetical protein